MIGMQLNFTAIPTSLYLEEFFAFTCFHSFSL